MPPDLIGQGSKNTPSFGQFVDDGLLLVGAAPAAQEIIQGGEFSGQGLAGVVLEGFGDQLAVGIEILHPLGGHLDLDIGHDITANAAAFLVRTGFGDAGPILVFVRVPGR